MALFDIILKLLIHAKHRIQRHGLDIIFKAEVFRTDSNGVGRLVFLHENSQTSSPYVIRGFYFQSAQLCRVCFESQSPLSPDRLTPTSKEHIHHTPMRLQHNSL